MHHVHTYAAGRLRLAGLLLLHEELQRVGREAGDPGAESEAHAAWWLDYMARGLGVEAEVGELRGKLAGGALAGAAALVTKGRKRKAVGA